MLLQQEKLPNSRLALYLEGVPKTEEEGNTPSKLWLRGSVFCALELYRGEECRWR